ncbi:MAG: prephenate dehydrogenase/arogenate dehydrogenase family protein, partial [candidate division NC10 bacterium]
MTFRSTPESPIDASSRGVPLFQRITIIGLGLIGGSVGLACRARRLAIEVRGADHDPDHRAQAIALGCVGEAFEDSAAAIDGADLVVLAIPVGEIPRVIQGIAPHLPPGAVVTDVGSVKGPVAAAMERLLPGGKAVPGHPIAGRELSGPMAASAELFVGAKCVLTPIPTTDPVALERVRGLWTAIGADVLEMSPERHDEIFAAISHLPHIVAYALMGTILDLSEDGEDLHEFAAGGLKDFTRVAMSHPVMWRDICLANRQQILEMIRRFQSALSQLMSMISAEDGEGLYRQFARARTAREAVGRVKGAGNRTRSD